MFCSKCGEKLFSEAGCPKCGTAGPVAEQQAKSRRRTIVLLLVVLPAIGLLFGCGLISLIAVPNFLNALDRGKQKRTQADMRTIVAGLESYVEAHGAYPLARNIDELEAALEPDHVRTISPVDGWARPFEVACDAEACEVRSTGKDGARDSGPPRGETERFVDDIVWRDGTFVQWPARFQR